MPTRKIIITVFLLLLPSMACNSFKELIFGKPIVTSEVIGTYRADYSFATEVLTLEPDGKFHQRIKLKDKEVESEGMWEFKEGMQEIIFDEHLLSTYDPWGNFDPNFQKPKSGRANIMVHRGRKGSLKFGGLEDRGGYAYFKEITNK